MHAIAIESFVHKSCSFAVIATVLCECCLGASHGALRLCSAQPDVAAENGRPQKGE